ncbi:MAG: Lrp/AsnC family transcriptional regulator, partial [Erysipelotrichaceae bacterium]|nr:Lrp/AsnC family transcriptional regulator [Erysipelotrichaceae bacterium]
MLKELLNLLEKNARYTTRDLAMLLDEDERDVDQAISQAEKDNIIAGYHTVINWDKTDSDIVKALITVNCR